MIYTILQTGTGDTSTSSAVLITLSVIGTIGVGGLAKLIQMWIDYVEKKKISSKAPAKELKDSLKSRVVELESKVDSLQIKIEEMIKMYTERILFLSTENARLQAELESAHKEIEKLLTDLEENE